MNDWLAITPQLLLQGASIGAVYALVALGLVLGYQATGLMNFAQGDLVMLGAFLGWWAVVTPAVPFVLALPLAAAVTGAVAYALEATVMRRVGPHRMFSGVLLTIGLGYLIRGLVSMTFGPESRQVSAPWTGRVVSIGDRVLALDHVVAFTVACAVTVGLFAFLRRTAVGIALRACAQNPDAAAFCGIPVARLRSVAWGLSGAIAAVAGLLLAPITLVDLALWLVLLKGFAAWVLGGFGNMAGAIVGGLLLGISEQFAGVFAPDGTKDLLPYAVLIGVLMLRPRGLLGEPHGQRS